MYYLILGFFTGLSLILAIGAQNIFVIEQGLKKQYVFLVCLICSLSDLILILLFFFLVYFVTTKIRFNYQNLDIKIDQNKISLKDIFLKTLGFTYLNPHVYSDTVFFLGNFSKNFLLTQKYYFGTGAAIASFLFFFSLGYLSKFLSKYLKNTKAWKIINLFIIIFMSSLAFYVLLDIFNLKNRIF